jgi:uncharacterized membrane protein
MVESVLRESRISVSQQSSDQYVWYRHRAQQIVLENMRQTAAIAIATVRDDIGRVLAIPYFTIDLMLLRRLFSSTSP